jgi:hypothetical protein
MFVLLYLFSLFIVPRYWISHFPLNVGSYTNNKYTLHTMNVTQKIKKVEKKK